MHVTVVMPTYNGERYVAEAIASVLAQTHTALDLVVVDDGSTDSTREVVRSVADSRTRLIEQENGGVAAARNRGLCEASGDVVAFLDQDDVWLPEKLAKQLPLLTEGVGVVGSRMTYLGPNGPTGATAGEESDQERIAAAKLMPFPPSSMIAQVNALETAGGFDAELVRTVGPVDDLDLLSRVARTHRIVTAPESLGFYRIHADAGSFARFYDMQLGTRFLQARIEARAQGRALTWEEWSSQVADGRSVRRLERAKYLYRAAGFRLVSGQRVRGGGTLAVAAALAPGYVVPRLARQFGLFG